MVLNAIINNRDNQKCILIWILLILQFLMEMMIVGSHYTKLVVYTYSCKKIWDHHLKVIKLIVEKK